MLIILTTYTVIHHNKSPYNAFDNNPIYFADPSGADAEGGNESSNSNTQISSGVGGITFDLATHPGAISYQSYSEGHTTTETRKWSLQVTVDGEGERLPDAEDREYFEDSTVTTSNTITRTIFHPGSVVGLNTPSLSSLAGYLNDGIGGFGEGLSYNGRKGNRLFVEQLVQVNLLI